MKRSTEKRRKARERKAKSRALALEGVTRVGVLVDIAQAELLRRLGLLKGEGKASEIAAAIGVLLRCRPENVRRDTRAGKSRQNGDHESDDH